MSLLISLAAGLLRAVAGSRASWRILHPCKRSRDRDSRLLWPSSSTAGSLRHRRAWRRSWPACRSSGRALPDSRSGPRRRPWRFESKTQDRVREHGCIPQWRDPVSSAEPRRSKVHVERGARFLEGDRFLEVLGSGAIVLLHVVYGAEVVDGFRILGITLDCAFEIPTSLGEIVHLQFRETEFVI